MKYWHVYWDATKRQYQIAADRVETFESRTLVVFKNFDMAYDYVTKANKMTDVMAYSRWAR